LFGVLILLALEANSSPLVDATSARSPEAFGSCFIRSEERNGRAWAYMPTARGGTLTDSGAGGATASYWAQLHQAGTGTRVRLFVANGTEASHLAEAVEQCR